MDFQPGRRVAPRSVGCQGRLGSGSADRGVARNLVVVTKGCQKWALCHAPVSRVATPIRERAPDRRTGGDRWLAGNRHQARMASRIDLRDGLHQGLGVGVALLGEDLLSGGLFHGPAGVHDHYLVGPALDDSEVVGDEDHRHAPLGTEVVEQVQDVLLDGDVQGRGGFIGDEDPWFARQGCCDHDPLAEAS